MEKEINFQNAKFRASSIGILIGALKIGITDAQEKELEKLQIKLDSGKKLTELQEKKYTDLMKKKNAPPYFTSGGISYLEKFFKEIVFNRKKEISTPQMEKGTDVEDESISIVNNYFGTNHKKNKNKYQNDWITGTPDIITGTGNIIDIKSSWDLFSFPLLEENLSNNIYKWQVKAYCFLTGGRYGYISYVLTNTPKSIITDEIFKYARKNGIMDVPEEIENQIYYNHTFDDIDLPNRIKIFRVDIEDSDTDIIITAVETARRYLTEMYRNFKNK